MISKGMLDNATANAMLNVAQLYSYAEAGIPVIGCEPSCLLTFRDEYPQLVRNEKARKVADNTYMIDEFLMKLKEDGIRDQPRSRGLGDVYKRQEYNCSTFETALAVALSSMPLEIIGLPQQTVSDLSLIHI